MKNIYLKLLFLFISIHSYSQEVKPVQNPDEDNTIFNTSGIEKKPEYPGGMTAFYNFIAANYKIPDTKGQSGKVFVTFVVEKDGHITDIKVLRDIGFGTGDAAIKVLRQCRNWIPGEQEGKKVRVLYSLPIQIGK